MTATVGGRKRDTDYPLAVSTMYGLGDTIYQRPFLRALGKRFPGTSVKSPWPELLEDLPGLALCRPHDTSWLHTQDKNVARNDGRVWAQWPARQQTVNIRYRMRDETGKSIMQEMEEELPLCGEPFVFDLPSFGPPIVEGRYAVVRPNTVRKEWPNPARLARTEYINRAAERLREMGYTVVAVADAQEGSPGAVGLKEWFHGDRPQADIEYVHGELDVTELMRLIEHASVCVGSVGFIAPVSLVYSTPVLLIAGGQGGFNAPERVVDSRIADRPHAWLLPDRYCRCKTRGHHCDKVIGDFDTRLEDALCRLI